MTFSIGTNFDFRKLLALAWGKKPNYFAVFQKNVITVFISKYVFRKEFDWTLLLLLPREIQN